MAGRRASGREPKDRPLPGGFTSIRDILDDRVNYGTLVTIVGLVKDMQAPVTTKGSDWKCRLKIYDKSTEDTDETLPINIFRPQNEMPNLAAGDVLVAYMIKVQRWGGDISLITNRTTSLHVYSRHKIPKPPNSAKDSMKPTQGRNTPMPKDNEHLYVSWLYHNIQKDTLPSEAEYQEQVQRSVNVKEKFSLLQDVRESRFYDLVVQVAQTPFDSLDRCTIWVTDYTVNEAFFKHMLNASRLDGGVDGDPYGYTAKHRAPIDQTGWPGPFGQRCMQMTCYEPHATEIRTAARPGGTGIRRGDWVRLRNVQVKYGHNGSNLEGFLREDRQRPGCIRVELLDTGEDPESIDPRLKEALRRKRDHEKSAKKQLKELAASRPDNGTKRKAEGKLTSRKRRKLQRSALGKKEKEKLEVKAKTPDLNPLVKCESEDQDVFSLGRILEGTDIKPPGETGERQSVALPFDNVKFRANVRVVNFLPEKLENFTAWKTKTEYDVLSDNGEQSGSDSDPDEDEGMLKQYVGEKVWEWQFALELEEVNPERNKNNKPPRVWSLVDNIEAQQLLRMDAADLRANPEDLETLRRRLWLLWGNLEDHKKQQHEQKLRNQKRVNTNQPPPDSSDDEAGDTAPGANKTPELLSNQPFTCCLRQYGIKVPESDARKCDAGEGKRYQRLFSLFGTTISDKTALDDD